jgi:hypothetical protein
MINAIYQVQYWLTTKAKEILDLLDDNKLKAINDKMKENRKEIQPIRAALSKTTTELHSLAIEFANSTGAV